MSRKQVNNVNAQRNQFNKSNNDNLILSVTVGMVACFATMIILSVLFSFLSLKFRNPINLTNILSIVCVVLGGLSSGFCSSLKYKKNPFLASFICNTIISIIIFMINLMSGNTNVFNMIFFPVLFIALGMICGMIYNAGKNKKRVKKYLK